MKIDDYWPTFGWGRCRFCKDQCTSQYDNMYWVDTHFSKPKYRYRPWAELECRKRRSSLYWITVEKIQKTRENYNLNGMPQDTIYHCDPC